MSAVFEKQPEANVARKEGVEYSGRREDQKDTQNQAQIEPCSLWSLI